MHPASKPIKIALLLVLGVFALRLIYLIWLCPYDLVEDEAHYWLWAQYLDWSYYSKGPGVAWAIALSTRIFGNAEWAVRLPALIMSLIGGLTVIGLTHDVARGASRTLSAGTIALYSAAAYLLAPVMQMTSILMTIDGPFMACWAIACWAAWRILERASKPAWIALGAAFAFGFLFKYTMLLLLPGLLIYAWSRRKHIRGQASLSAPWVIAGGLVALLGLLPVVIWNAQNGWVTVKHLMGHMGIRGGDVPTQSIDAGQPWSIAWFFEFIGQQFGIVGPALALALIAVWKFFRAKPRDPAPGKLFLICCGLPVLVFYAFVSLVTETEGNWPIAAYVTLLPLAGWWAAELAQERRDRAAAGQHPRRGSRLLWHATIIYGVCAALLLHRTDLWAHGLNTLNQTTAFRAAFERITGREPRPVEVGRLMGSKVMGVHAARLLDDLRARTGQAPFLVGDHYGRISQLAYYLMRDGGRHVDVFAAMKQVGGRTSQFDVWPHTSLARPDLVGRPALIISGSAAGKTAFWNQVFEKVEPVPGERLDGEHREYRKAFFGTGYRGWSEDGARLRENNR